MHTVLGVLMVDGSSRDRFAVPGLDESATFVGEDAIHFLFRMLLSISPRVASPPAATNLSF
jgi:hypothetical protein